MGVGNRAPLPGEFALIRKYFAPLAAGFSGALDLEDDACTYAVPAGHELVLTADALVEGRHYLGTDPADLIARKMLRVNLSDLAAKGAKPVGYLMTTALGPDIDEDWIAKFAAGLAADQREYGLALMGGDTVATPGPTTLSVTALGIVPTGRALRRRGARPGDRLFVSGTIGDGILGLKVLRAELLELGSNHRDALADRYHLPQPRVQLGAALLAGGAVTAAMDVSDGLVADAGHIADASHCGLIIHADRVPLSPAAQEALAEDLDLLPVLLSGGDDYELLFTAGAGFTAPGSGTPVAEIGAVVSGSGVKVLDRDGVEIPLTVGGWQHF
ncbi:thiamine-phosphate kinase [Dongia sedimenti]|uniref:Thiamine-monophosphate kinase n=1 Tax=Dongia sedimenti TaxID=3064282 RepID=A0ABU0YLZ3_9PROT|nr:thiamine-phosphate kinase [Rhodospirillaceae bacterium R-7]